MNLSTPLGKVVQLHVSTNYLKLDIDMVLLHLYEFQGKKRVKKVIFENN